MQNTENTKEIELEIIQKIPDELLSEHLKCIVHLLILRDMLKLD